MILSRSISRLALGSCFAIALVFSQSANADWKDDVGFTQLMNELGGSTPTGAGIVVSMIEAPVGAGMTYFPDTANTEFSGKTLIDGSGGGTTSNAHANAVAEFFFGNTDSIAGGVTNITIYEANHWINNVTNAGNGNDPAAQNFSVQNHSWIGAVGDNAIDTDILRRVDFMADQNEMTIVVGLNNNNELNPTKPHPRLLSHAFNAIAVGVTDSTHSRGNTSIYTPGRIRPDVVAPQGATSFSTPMVSGAATLLHEVANGIADPTARMNARRSETIRAIIMAGATKQEFSDWDRTTTRPLDDIYGAGELNIYNSFKILDGGEFDGTTTAPVTAVGQNGYDYVEGLDPADELFFNFEVGPDEIIDELSILLTWNMEITDNDGSGVFDPIENIANMNLAFYDSTNSFMDLLLDESISPVDNREHLYFRRLGPGTYTLVVSTDRDQDFAVAWRYSHVPEPGSAVFLAVLTVGLVRRRRRRA